jgi:NitT/TauT family transport system substrate-binding protein
VKLRVLAAVAAAAMTALAAACGSSSGAADEPPPDGERRAITVGVMPIAESAAVYVAEAQGFFDDEGLDVTIETGRTSSAILPSVVSGQYDVGFSTLVTLMLARSQGLELTAIAGASVPAVGDDYTAIIAKDPQLKTASDLVGRKIGVNALNNIAAVSVRAAVQADGGDAGDLEFVELGFAEQVAAIERGDIDAGLTVEPFLAVAADAGLHVVSYPYQAIDPDIVIGSYVVKEGAAENDEDLVKRFRAALYRGAELANSDPAALKSAIQSFSTIDSATYDRMIVPRYATSLPRSSAEIWADLMVEQGVLPKAPDLAGVVTN